MEERYLTAFSGVVEKVYGQGHEQRIQIKQTGFGPKEPAVAVRFEEYFGFRPRYNGGVIPFAKAVPLFPPEPGESVAVVFEAIDGTDHDIGLAPKGWGNGREFSRALRGLQNTSVRGDGIVTLIYGGGLMFAVQDDRNGGLLTGRFRIFEGEEADLQPGLAVQYERLRNSTDLDRCWPSPP